MLIWKGISPEKTSRSLQLSPVSTKRGPGDDNTGIGSSGGLTMWKSVTVRLLAIGLVFCAAPVLGQVYTVDYYGFGWETGGILPSVMGDELVITCSADNVDPAFGVDLGTAELTLHIHDLISAGQVDMGGYYAINFTGGMMDVYEDQVMNADWGTNPPNGVSPSTFADGSLFFSGQFTSFTMYFDGSGSSGSFSGTLDGVGGSIIDQMCTSCVYTWGGAFTMGASAQIPVGYDLQIDGVFEIDSAVDNEPTSWGSVKALFH